MPETTDWRKLYLVAALLGALFGWLLVLGWLPAALPWPEGWNVLLPLGAGTLAGLALAGAAHLGVRWQLRRRPDRRDDR